MKLGHDLYHRQDAFGLPDPSLDQEELEEIQSCFQQFLEGKGYKQDAPVEGVSIHGFYLALRTLHFQRAGQMVSGTPDGGMLDHLLFRHALDGEEITLYNLVYY